MGGSHEWMSGRVDSQMGTDRKQAGLLDKLMCCLLGELFNGYK